MWIKFKEYIIDKTKKQLIDIIANRTLHNYVDKEVTAALEGHSALEKFNTALCNPCLDRIICPTAEQAKGAKLYAEILNQLLLHANELLEPVLDGISTIYSVSLQAAITQIYA